MAFSKFKFFLHFSNSFTVSNFKAEFVTKMYFSRKFLKSSRAASEVASKAASWPASGPTGFRLAREHLLLRNG